MRMILYLIVLLPVQVFAGEPYIDPETLIYDNFITEGHAACLKDIEIIPNFAECNKKVYKDVYLKYGGRRGTYIYIEDNYLKLSDVEKKAKMAELDPLLKQARQVDESRFEEHQPGELEIRDIARELYWLSGETEDKYWHLL